MSTILVLAFLMTWLGTYFLRQVALDKNMLDVPNARSSHKVPTPRGGGVAFVLTYLLFMFLFFYRGWLSPLESLAFIGAGFLVALLGFLDDLGFLNIRWRLLGHFLASIMAMIGLGGVPTLDVLVWNIHAHLLLDTVGVVYLVWLLNLYNFMDGIDGIAGVQAVSVCLSMACIYYFTGVSYLMPIPLLIAASTAGFLCWNAPVARIFMGDAGSGFLGFILGLLSIQGAWIHSKYFWCWLILLGVFLVDATITIVTRGLQGVKVYEAHRTHAYQHAASLFGRHDWVTLAVLVINVLWLCPIAWSVGAGYVHGCVGLVFAYVPLVILALYFRAGKKAKETH